MSSFSVDRDSLDGLANAMGDYSGEINRLQGIHTGDLVQFASAQVIAGVEEFNGSLNLIIQQIGASMQEIEQTLRQGAAAYVNTDTDLARGMRPA